MFTFIVEFYQYTNNRISIYKLLKNIICIKISINY